MKYLIYIFVFITLISCKSPEKADDSTLTKIILLGPDYRKCMCCGGMLMSFNLDAKLYNDSTSYLINEVVKNDILTDSINYPMIVKVDWKFVDAQCGFKKVDILKIAK